MAEKWRLLALLAMVGVLDAPVMARPTDAERCEAEKSRVAGEYSRCRLRAHSKAIRRGVPADYSRCDNKLVKKWVKAEATGACSDMVTVTDVQAYVIGHTDALATALNGGGLPHCGDDAINVPGEQCDGIELGGADCTNLGFDGGTLTCDSTCRLDPSGCEKFLPSSGQTVNYGAGSDGDVRAGAPLSFVDNGDGTLTDLNTGLMWEKKDDSGGVHDKDNVYTWCADVNPFGGGCDDASSPMDGTIGTVFLAALNAGDGFAGYTDWRIPNVKELHSIIDYGTFSPSVSLEFHRSATCGGCADLTSEDCSCTASGVYWSSTAFAANSLLAYCPFFGTAAGIGAGPKADALHVRAVRGGL